MSAFEKITSGLVDFGFLQMQKFQVFDIGFVIFDK